VTTRAAELPSPARSGAIETVDVPNNRRVVFVVGQKERPIVYLHGMCSEPRPALEAWSSSVREQGTIIALEGDAACSDRGGRTYSTDISALDARIDAAIDAVAFARDLPLDRHETIVIGESLGASRAIALASQFHAKYPRLVLVGGPEAPSARELGGVRAVALLAGEKEPQGKMRQGAASLENAGVAARFWELAGATHGTYGPDGARSMADAVAFVVGH
jgi:pimeloyl-ACP methyl ester carboxylesterase